MNATTEPWTLDADLPFASAFITLVDDARAQLCFDPSVDAPIGSQLGEQLRSRLAYLAAPALHAVFVDPNLQPRDGAGTARYRAFTSAMNQGRLGELGAEFPVLTDLLEMTCGQWVTTTQLLLDRVVAARPRIAEVFGIPAAKPLIGVEVGLGDRHNGGQTVVLLRFAGGRKLLYKPRGLATEDHFFNIWSAFRLLVDDDVPLPKVMSAGTHGFMEFVDAARVVDGHRYWRRAGELVGLLHLCAAEDLHYENLIATSASPVPVDLECIDQPNRFGSREDRTQFVTDSVLATGMFPNWFVGAGADPADAVGLFAGQRTRPVGTMTVWTSLGTDGIDRARVPYTRLQGDNAAVGPDGAPVVCDQKALRDGMHAAFRLGPRLVDAAGTWPSARFLSRPTAAFAAARTTMLELDALREPDEFVRRSVELPEMEPELEALLGERRDIVVQADAMALRRLDIPIHHCSGAALLVDGGAEIASLFAETGEDHRRERHRRLTPAGVSFQQELVTLAVEQFEGVFWQRDAAKLSDGAASQSAASTASSDRAIEAAEQLGNDLKRRAVETSEGMAWLEVDQLTPMRGLAHQTNLYAGSDGIALFFAALAQATHSDKWAELARGALAATPSARHTEAWVENGWAGRFYARSVCAELLDQPQLRSEAHEILDDGWPRPPADDDKLDVLGGWSGVLLALLATCPASHTARSIANELTDWLTDQVDARLDNPIGRRALIRMGFAHGTTGMSYALARAAVELDHAGARAASKKLADIEEERIAARGGAPGSLQGLGAAKTPARSWCWGVGGYVMARSQPDWVAVHGTASHLDNAAAILTAGNRERSHACCGEAGQLMALVELCTTNAAADNTSAGHTAAADALADALSSEAHVGGPWQFYHETTIATPGLFWGLAGVGYSLLRYAQPALVPNFLLFQPAGTAVSSANKPANDW